jgi:GNAT superfamily N-acetyltransferase
MANYHSVLSLPNLPSLIIRLVPENQLSDIDHRLIQDLLIAAFPQYTEIFTQASYWGARPTYRLWIAIQDGKLLAHLDFELRRITIGETKLLIAGVGEVATHPRFHKHGLGRALMDKLYSILLMMSVPFGYLQCRPAVVNFYTNVGWHLVTQTVCYIDPDTNQETLYNGPSLILPVCVTSDQWPTGTINLMGMPW